MIIEIDHYAHLLSPKITNFDIRWCQFVSFIFVFLFCFSVCHKKCAKIIFSSCLTTGFKAWFTLSLCFRYSRFIQNKFICNVCFFAPFVDIWFLLLIASSQSTIFTHYFWSWKNFVKKFCFFFFSLFHTFLYT